MSYSGAYRTSNTDAVQFGLDISTLLALLIIAYASFVIYMHSRNERPVGLHGDLHPAALLSEHTINPASSNSKLLNPSSSHSKKQSPEEKTERLLRTIQAGREFASASGDSGATHEGLARAQDQHSPGTNKRFEWAHLFHPQPKLLLAAPALFADLRQDIFGLPPDKYYDQHLSVKGTREVNVIKPSDDTLGFSGSQFYFTHDKALIVKSIPRAFESGFLLDQMLDAYAEHIKQSYRRDPSDPNKLNYSLLTQKTDVLYPPYHNVLGMLGIGGEGGVWIIMKNSLLLNPPGEEDKFIKATADWDLKPPHFFEPTRDLVPDRLKTSAAKSGLADAHIPLKDRPVVSSQKRSELLDVLRRDAEFLCGMHVVDYSVLLGRWDRTSYPYPLGPEEEQKWSEAVESKNGKWVYRIALVDFLWSQKGGLRPKVTKTAGKAIPEQTISTEPDRYKDAVIGMCESWILTESPSQEEVRREEAEQEQEQEEQEGQ